VKAFRNVLKEYGSRVKKSEIRKLMGISSESIWSLLKKKYHLKQGAKKLREERRYEYFKLLGTKNIVYSFTPSTLKTLKKKYKIAIATGSSTMSLVHSVPPSFIKEFDCIVTIDKVKHGKPNPEQLFFAMKKLKIKPEECLMIGDSIYDGLAAKKAGVDFVGVKTGYTSKKLLLENHALAVLRSVKKLPDFLSRKF
jgi:HAD superfamily hydrolase (TIGR01549 family)